MKTATQAICDAEDELIGKSKGVQKIGIIKDLQISLLNDKHGVICEKLKLLREDDLITLRLLEEPSS